MYKIIASTQVKVEAIFYPLNHLKYTYIIIIYYKRRVPRLNLEYVK